MSLCVEMHSLLPAAIPELPTRSQPKGRNWPAPVHLKAVAPARPALPGRDSRVYWQGPIPVSSAAKSMLYTVHTHTQNI